MTQEEKDLVVKDLCGRLPFHVKVAIDFEGYMEVLPDDENLQYPYRKNLKFILYYNNKTIEDISKEPHILYAYPCTERFEVLRGYTYELEYGVPVEFIKPYLRPMSSMTEEEKEHLQTLHNIISDENYGDGFSPAAWEAILDFNNYCREHHLDNGGLITLGLALEAPEDMYDMAKKILY